MQEKTGAYKVNFENEPTETFFNHERLKVFKEALNFVELVDNKIQNDKFGTRYGKKLDILSTSITLNIAEGNGRFDLADHRKFIDISHTSALKQQHVLIFFKLKISFLKTKLNKGRCCFM